MLRAGRALLITSALGVAALALPAAAQVPLQRLTVDEAVAAALQHNPSLRAKTLELGSTQANEITAGLRPNPVASYLAEQLGNRNVDSQQTVTLGQPIETGGKRRRRLESARAATAVTTEEIADARRQVILLVRKAFTDALVARATIELAEDNLKALDEVERLQRFRVERGDLSELELLRLQVQRFAFERDATDARQAGETARIALRSAIGPAGLAESVEIVGARTSATSRSTRPRCVVARWRRARPPRRRGRSGQGPRRRRAGPRHAWWDSRRSSSTSVSATTTRSASASASRCASSTATRARCARPQRVSRAAALRQAAATQALAEVDTAYAGVLVLRERVISLRDVYLPKATQARQTVEFAYRRGGVSLLDFLDAQRTYRETALEHLRALGNLRAAVDQLEAAIGRRRLQPIIGPRVDGVHAHPDARGRRPGPQARVAGGRDAGVRHRDDRQGAVQRGGAGPRARTAHRPRPRGVLGTRRHGRGGQPAVRAR
jgi:cobalt-zinc-cadmium efflux system outer membrane protein